MILRA
jgi:hypothetical protein